MPSVVGDKGMVAYTRNGMLFDEDRKEPWVLWPIERDIADRLEQLSGFKKAVEGIVCGNRNGDIAQMVRAELDKLKKSDNGLS